MYPFSSLFVFMDKISYLMILLTIIIYFIINNMTMLSESLNLCLKLCCFFSFIFFLVNNLFLLLFCFESVLIFIYLVILGWGYTQERLQAGYYLILYTIMYSFPLILMVLSLAMNSSLYLYSSYLIIMTSFSSFLIFLPFLVKCPIYFLHLWLPKAHVEAPVVGSIILAGILLKLGTYGLYRLMNMFIINHNFIYMIVMVVVIGLIFSTFICLLQSDQKSMIAYMSVNHMGLLVMTLFISSNLSIVSSVILMFFHGLVSSMLFYSSYLMFYSSYSRVITVNQGFLFLNLVFMLVFLIFMMMNMSVPIFSTFFLEWMMYTVMLNYSLWFFIIMIICLLVFAYICFYLLSNSFHGKSLSFYWGYENYLFFSVLIFCLYLPWIF